MTLPSVPWQRVSCVSPDGYKGRMGLHELLLATDEIKTLIHARAPVLELLKVAVAKA